jgi:putative heme iron utilization protein
MDQRAEQEDVSHLVKAQAVYDHLLNGCQSLMLATINQDRTPLASYTPFVVDQARRFYIFISSLAHHTANLQRRRQASLMLIEDERAAAQIFARRRLTFQCEASFIERGTDEWEMAGSLYQARFGEFFAMIKSFSDFQMCRLSPTEGWLVIGFGQAYAISGKNLDILSHRSR